MTLHIVGPDFSTLTRSVRLYCLENDLEFTHGMTLDSHPIAFRSAVLKRLHPFGQVPVLLHDDQVVFETLPICRYVERTLLDRSTPWRLQVETWASALVTTVDTRLVRRYLLRVAGPRSDLAPGAPELIHVEADIRLTLTTLAVQLGEQPFFCGESFSVADALLAPMLDYLAQLPHSTWLTGHPGLADYLQRLRQRSSGRQILTAPTFTPATTILT